MWVPFSRKIYGVSGGAKLLGSGFPIRARSIPVSTRFSFGKSSVLYLLHRHEVVWWLLERGCPTLDSQIQAATWTAEFKLWTPDFVGWKEHKTTDFVWAKSGCSGGQCQRGRKRYIKPAATIRSRIRYDYLYHYVLTRIQYLSRQAQLDEKWLLHRLLKASDQEIAAKAKRQSIELTRAEKRRTEADCKFAKLYEDWSDGHITEHNFNMMSQKYQTEQQELTEKIEGVSSVGLAYCLIREIQVFV